MHIDAQLIESGERLDELEGELAALDEVAADADADAVAAAAALMSMQRRVHILDARIVIGEADLAATGRDLRSAEADVVQVLREPRYEGDGSELEALVLAVDLQQYSDLALLNRVARRSHEADLSRLGRQREEIQQSARRLIAEREAVVTARARAQQEADTARAAADTALAARAALEAALDEQRELVTRFEGLRRDEERRLSELERASEGVAALLAQRAWTGSTSIEPAAGAPASTAVGALSWPVNGQLSSPFGYRIHPILGGRGLHTGVDVAAACGTPVRAAADGTVLSAAAAGGYGNQIVVTHGSVAEESVGTTYNHLTSFAVTSGEVTRGQVIGFVGSTGLSTGCHLHFEVRTSGTPVDPLPWLTTAG